MTEGRRDDGRQREVDDGDNGQRQEVEVGGPEEVDIGGKRQHRPRHADQPDIAAQNTRELVVGEHAPYHLGKSKGQHQEVNTAGTEGERPHECEERTGYQSDREQGEEIRAKVQRPQRAGIGARRIKGGMAERGHPRVTEEEVEGHGKDGEDQRL